MFRNFRLGYLKFPIKTFSQTIGFVNMAEVKDSPQIDPVEILPSPIKSESDKHKEYRVIRLANGLTACLISDTSSFSPTEETEEFSDSEDDGNVTASESESEDDQMEIEEVEADSVKKKTLQLGHKMAAAALCVKVGSFSDPKELPGLAHLLEHMVFMGSEKYPTENDFDAFIKKGGGSDNASTDCETTTFHFECLNKHLQMGLDRFSQFFISPLMLQDSLTREREAMESEFQMALPSDMYRKEQMLLNMFSDKVPLNSFTWGNLLTMKDQMPDKEVYTMLHEFRQKHYSANRMTVAIQARQSLDQLESYVKEYFGKIPNNGSQPPDFTIYKDGVFDQEKFTSMYYIKPVKDTMQLDLTWALPSMFDSYLTKPHQYVASILGDEGRGSIISYLRSRLWALSIYTGNGESGSEYNSMYCLFTISIILTKGGLENVDEVIAAVFSYLNLLRQKGPSEQHFMEMKHIDDTSFKFAKEQDPVDYVESIVENMQIYPSEHYITGSELYFKYDKDKISSVINALTPDKMNVMISSPIPPKADLNYDETEQWFRTRYARFKIPEDKLSKWKNVQPFSTFHLPLINSFLTTDFNILPAIPSPSVYPQKIFKSNLIELWYKKDDKFGLPIAHYNFNLITTYAFASAQRAAMLDLYINFLHLESIEEAYPALVADLNFSISVGDRGIILKVNGYNQKLHLLINLLGRHMKSLASRIDQEFFDVLKLRQIQTYYNKIMKPSVLCKEIRMQLLLHQHYTLVQKYEALSSVSLEMMKEFFENILKKVYVQCLVQGNVLEADAIKTANKFLDQLKCNPYHMLPFKNRVYILPNGKEFCARVDSINVEDANSIVTNYYQADRYTCKESAIIELLMMMIEEPLFDTLRTKEQLGYHVSCTTRDTLGILGYSISVHSQVTKFTVREIEQKIENFIKTTHKNLQKLNEKKLGVYKKNLIKIKGVADVDLADEVNRNWSEILDCVYLFDRIPKEIEAIQETKANAVKKWWESHNTFGSRSNLKKLSIQVEGHVDGQSRIPSGYSDQLEQRKRKSTISTVSLNPDIEGVNAKSYIDLVYRGTKEECHMDRKAEDYFIKHPNIFKMDLHLHVM